MQPDSAQQAIQLSSHDFADFYIPPSTAAGGSEKRRGVSTVMMLIFLPCLLVLTIIVSEIGSLYVAKKELRHSLEAGALSAALVWHNPKADPADARDAALAYTAANTVRGKCIDLDEEIVVTPKSPDGPKFVTTAGRVTLGSAVPNGRGRWIFIPDVPPVGKASAAVQLEMTQRLDGNVSEVFGLTPPNYEVSGMVTARTTDEGIPELIGVVEP